MDEIIHDLTPYGYKPISNSDAGLAYNTYYGLNKQMYVKTFDGYTMHKQQTGMYDNVTCVDVDDISYLNGNGDIVYAEDIIADVVLNSNESINGIKLITEVSKYVGSDTIRKIANENFLYNRKLLLIKRRTITRHTKKIMRIIFENKVDMTVKADDVVDMSIKEDIIQNTGIVKDEIETFIPKNKRKKSKKKA